MSLESFREALAATLRWEGVYSNDPRDPGGETVLGIARKRHPDWPGWRRVDALRAADGWPAILERDVALQEQVRRFYYDEFWRRLEEIEIVVGEAVAAKAFDASVNVGSRRAIELLQCALAAVGERIDLDGIAGTQTLTAAARTGIEALPLFRAALAGYYTGLAAGNPNLKPFLNGWRRRALA